MHESQQTGQKVGEKGVQQLAEVHLYRSYFLQNPYFNCFYLNFLKVVKNDECFQIHTKRALL
jgi:hypothetical protein